jgi:uncharacterized protein YndB with AHSA1/START domain
VSEPTTIHNTFVIERPYPKPPTRLFLAFSDPEQKRRWFANSRGQDDATLEMDFRVGGREAMSYKMGPDTPFPGTVIANSSVYLDIVEDRRVVLTQAMTLGDRRISAALITVEFLGDGQGGTTLICTHQAAFFEGSDGPTMREGGWNTLLDRLGASLAD